jgi:hypothetical protein
MAWSSLISFKAGLLGDDFTSGFFFQHVKKLSIGFVKDGRMVLSPCRTNGQRLDLNNRILPYN